MWFASLEVIVNQEVCNLIQISKFVFKKITEARQGPRGPVGVEIGAKNHPWLVTGGKEGGRGQGREYNPLSIPHL